MKHVHAEVHPLSQTPIKHPGHWAAVCIEHGFAESVTHERSAPIAHVKVRHIDHWEILFDKELPNRVRHLCLAPSLANRGGGEQIARLAQKCEYVRAQLWRG